MSIWPPVATAPCARLVVAFFFQDGCSAGAVNINQKSHSPEFKDQALRELRERGSRTQNSVALELNCGGLI